MVATKRRLEPLSVDDRLPALPEVLDQDDPDPTIELEAPNRALDNVVTGSWRRKFRRWMHPTSPALTYLGVTSIAIGVGLIAYTWGRVAGTLAVPLQLPYVASGAVTGLAMVVVGSNLISIASKRRDTAVRARQLEELSALMRTIAEHAGGRL